MGGKMARIAGRSVLRSFVILPLLIAIACVQTRATTLVSESAPTPHPSPTPAPQIRVTALKPGENPWQVVAADQSRVVKLLTSHPTQPRWIYVVTGEDGRLAGC